MSKRCPVCGISKLLSEFYILKSGKPKSRCKDCGSAESKEYRKAHREACCKRDSEYYHKSDKVELNRKNRERYAKDSSRFLISNKLWEEENHEWRLQWRRNNRHISRRYCKVRAKRIQNAGYLGATTVREIEEENRDKYGVLTCVYCGTDVSDGYHLEHKRPISRGGTNAKENLDISCAGCNMKKGIMTVREFVA